MSVYRCTICGHLKDRDVHGHTNGHCDACTPEPDLVTAMLWLSAWGLFGLGVLLYLLSAY